MTTTRYFEVKVTGCKNCPDCAKRSLEVCNNSKVLMLPLTERIRIANDNYNQLTNTCPMAAQHKTEGEVLQNIRNLENNPYERI